MWFDWLYVGGDCPWFTRHTHILLTFPVICKTLDYLSLSLAFAKLHYKTGKKEHNAAMIEFLGIPGREKHWKIGSSWFPLSDICCFLY